MNIKRIFVGLFFFVTFSLKPMAYIANKREVSSLVNLAANRAIDQALRVYHQAGFQQMNNYFESALSNDVVDKIYHTMIHGEYTYIFVEELLHRFELGGGSLELFNRFDLSCKSLIMKNLIGILLPEPLPLESPRSTRPANTILRLIKQLIENTQDLDFYSGIVSLLRPLVKKGSENSLPWSEKNNNEIHMRLFINGKILQIDHYIKEVLAHLQEQASAHLNFSPQAEMRAKNLIENNFMELELESDEVLDYIFLKYFPENPKKFNEALILDYITSFFSSYSDEAYQQVSRLFRQFLNYYPKAADLIYRTNLKGFFDSKMKIALFLKKFLLKNLVIRISSQLKSSEKICNGTLEDRIYDIIYTAYTGIGLVFTDNLILLIITSINTQDWDECVYVLSLLRGVLNKLCFKESIDKNNFKLSFDVIEDKLAA